MANPDLTHPETHGNVAPETGALLAALNACVAPHRLEAEVIGKPFPRLFQRAIAALGATPEATVMIGDNPATDMAGAAALGMQRGAGRPGRRSRLRRPVGRAGRPAARGAARTAQNRLIDKVSKVDCRVEVARS